MNRRAGLASRASAAAVTALLAFSSTAVAAADPAAPADDPRSQELVDLHCRSDISRWRLTLFGNGTVRLREGLAEAERLRLGELGPEEMAAWRRRLAAEDLSEVDPAESSAEGDWVEICSLVLDDPEIGPRRRFRFTRWATMPLTLARVLSVLDGLALEADLDVGGERLPAGFVPRTGDVLRRGDGAEFRVVGPTADGGGWELAGVVVPLTLYLVNDDVPRHFVAIVSREGQ